MSQRKQQRRRPARPRRPRRNLLAKAVAVVGIVTLPATIAWNIRAEGRQSESRRAAVSIENYDKLKDAVEPWVGAAMDVFDTAEAANLRSGRWPRAKEMGMHRPVYHARIKVENLQHGMRDRKLQKLLAALRIDIAEVCNATSFPEANRAAGKMMAHWGKVNERIGELKDSARKQLQMIG
jgi:hypothetical protein